MDISGSMGNSQGHGQANARDDVADGNGTHDGSVTARPGASANVRVCV